MNYFAYHLKILRKEKGLSQSELAKEINVSTGMISCWENGKYEPTASNIISVAKFFDISIDDLFLTPIL